MGLIGGVHVSDITKCVLPLHCMCRSVQERTDYAPRFTIMAFGLEDVWFYTCECQLRWKLTIKTLERHVVYIF